MGRFCPSPDVGKKLAPYQNERWLCRYSKKHHQIWTLFSQVRQKNYRALIMLNSELLKFSILTILIMRFVVSTTFYGWTTLRVVIGLNAKRSEGRYIHKRSRDWLKFKCVKGETFVMTTGSKRLHVVVPIKAVHMFEEVFDFPKILFCNHFKVHLFL